MNMKKGAAEIIVALIIAILMMLTAIGQQNVPKNNLFDSGFCNQASDCDTQVLNKSSCSGSFSCEQNKCVWSCSSGFKTVECLEDSNCVVTGCSSQLCAPSQEKSGLITTCEYKEEYSCLKKTSCGCVSGTCQWKDNLEYRSCINNISNK